MSSNTRRLVLGALAAIAVAFIVVSLVPYTRGTMDAPDLAPSAADEASVAVDDPTTQDNEAASSEDAATGVMPPKVETFYMAPDGVATIAGRAAPHQTIVILLAGDPIAEVMTDSSGGFATTVVLEPSVSPRRLGLVADPGGAEIASVETFIIAPTAEVTVAENGAEAEVDAAAAALDLRDDPEGAAEAGVTTKDAGGAQESAIEGIALGDDDAVVALGAGTVVADAAEAGDTDEAPTSIDDGDIAQSDEMASDIPATTVAEMADASGEEPSDDGVEKPKTPTVIVADSDGVRVSQDARAPDVMAAIALDTITYDPAGEVTLAGRAQGEGFVQVYIDNRPVTRSRIDGGGWATELPQVDTGVYTLRIDEVDDTGAVTSRIETPFKREEAETVAAIMAEDTNVEGFDVAVRTVQPGSTLWAIAKEAFGSGIMYVEVYEANRELIKDPDLIYPGQVFRIPEAAE